MSIKEMSLTEARRDGRRFVDTVVIGGGQVGLTTGYYLKKQGRDFVILDVGEKTGETWRNRWDSLRLFTPARYDGLPGIRFPINGATYPTKDQMADYLESYAAHFDLPIRNRTRVDNVLRNGDRFMVSAGDAIFETNNVIVAMGNNQVPRIPPFAKELDPSIAQIHSKQYRNPSQIQPGRVLVVGAGNSGAEIALELSKTHETVLAGKDSGHIPFPVDSFIARHFLTRIVKFVFVHVLSLGTPIGRKALPKILGKGRPLVRVKPKWLIEAGVERVARIGGVKNGLPVTEDGRVLEVTNVVWCIGFRPGFSWIDLPIFGERQEPIHERGVVASEPGLYFVGLDFLYSIGSDTIPGHQRDAKFVTDHLAKNRPAAVPAELATAKVSA